MLQADEAYCIGPAPSSESYVRPSPPVPNGDHTVMKLLHG